MRSRIAHDALTMVDYRTAKSALLVGGSEAAARAASQRLEAAGFRISDTVALAGAAERIDRQAACDLLVTLIDDDPGAELDRYLEQVEAGARQGRFKAVLAAPSPLTDILFARTSHLEIDHLVEPDDEAWAEALRRAGETRPARLHDVRKGQTPPQLQQISEEVARLASRIASLSEDDLKPALPALEPGKEVDLDAGAIRAMIRARRLREQFFTPELFADPAWDMLLDLMAARLERQRVAVSSLCIAAAVPPTTALRWIKTLTEHGLFVRVADPHDGRRVFIELSDGAAAKLAAYLKAAQRISPHAI